MKKLLALFLAIFLILGTLASCGANPAPERYTEGKITNQTGNQGDNSIDDSNDNLNDDLGTGMLEGDTDGDDDDSSSDFNPSPDDKGENDGNSTDGDTDDNNNNGGNSGNDGNGGNSGDSDNSDNSDNSNDNVSGGDTLCNHAGGSAKCNQQAICMFCGQPYGELDPEHHPQSSTWNQTEYKHFSIYTCCNTIDVEQEDHDWNKGVCSVCGYECKHTSENDLCMYKEINSIETLREIELDGKYYLTGNIDMGGAEWTPMGDGNNPFVGTLDGNGYMIYNFVIEYNSGLSGFFECNNGNIQNLTLKDFTVNVENNSDTMYIGAMAGINGADGKIENCYAEGYVIGDLSGGDESYNCIGGLIGWNYGSIIECGANCTVSSNSNSSHSYAGGLIGYNYYGIISKSYAGGNVKAIYNSQVSNENSSVAGGLVAFNEGGAISNCYSIASVEAVSEAKGGSYAGGLVGFNGGENGSGTIAYCYATGNVISSCNDNMAAFAGGLVGFNDAESTIDNCYAIGNVLVEAISEYSCGGALCGFISSENEITNAYYCAEQTVDAQYTQIYGTETTLNALKSESFHITTIGWSSDIWNFVDGELPTFKVVA